MSGKPESLSLDAAPHSENATSGCRIAFLTGVLSLGGSTTFLINLCGELICRGIPCQVICFERENPLASDFKAANIPVLCLDHTKQVFEDRMGLALAAVREFNPSVVVANLSPIAFECLRYAPRQTLRVGIIHSDDEKVYDGLAPYGPWMDLLGVVSEKIMERAKTIPAFSETKLQRLPYGVPMPVELPPRDYSGPVRILYVGRVDRDQKRAHLFPELLAMLRKTGVPFVWTIAGDGSELADLRSKMIPEKVPAEIVFTGKVGYGQVPELLGTHDIYLLISEFEGLPLSLLEAMGYGLVPVVSDLPSGIGEVVDESTGVRVRPENLAAFAEAIASLDSDRLRFRKLSEAARAKVLAHYSIKAMTDRWLSALSNMPAGTHRAAWTDRVQPPLGNESHWQYSMLGKALRKLKKLRN